MRNIESTLPPILAVTNPFLDVGPLHLFQKLAGIGREDLRVEPLPLRLEGVQSGGMKIQKILDFSKKLLTNVKESL